MRYVSEAIGAGGAADASDEAGTSPPVPVHVERSSGGAHITDEASANTFHKMAPPAPAPSPRHQADGQVHVVVTEDLKGQDHLGREFNWD
jgi:hypothetical protein